MRTLHFIFPVQLLIFGKEKSSFFDDEEQVEVPICRLKRTRMRGGHEGPQNPKSYRPPGQTIALREKLVARASDVGPARARLEYLSATYRENRIV
jgi:hypothetical protein